MTIGELAQRTGFAVMTEGSDLGREVTGACCCDLLSWVIAKGAPGYAWVTVQTHMNVVAVAALHEFACVVLAEGATMPPEVLAKAEHEGVAVLGSPASEYAVSGTLYALGIGK